MTAATPGKVNDEITNVDSVIVGHIFMQLSLKQGPAQWKEQGKEAIAKELKQLYFWNTLKLIDLKMLTKKEMERVIESHLFLKLKWDSTIKGRMVASGNKQCGYILKEDAASLTASL